MKKLTVYLFLAVPFLLSLSACVDIPAGGLPADAVTQPVESPFKGLDPGYKTEETAHFSVQAYTTEGASRNAAVCEQDYARIMQDLGLYSFVPAHPYNVVVYRDAAEYHTKTSQPDWSGGATYGNALLLFESNSSSATASHEMTHLVFNDFMGLSQAAALRWLNEGVAVYEESRANQVSAAYYSSTVKDSVASNPIPFSQMVNLAPQSESRAGVERWYAQVGSVAGFMIKQGGSFSFSLFLGRLRDGASVDKAIEDTYHGIWKNLAEVEKAWQLDVKS